MSHATSVCHQLQSLLPGMKLNSSMQFLFSALSCDELKALDITRIVTPGTHAHANSTTAHTS